MHETTTMDMGPAAGGRHGGRRTRSETRGPHQVEERELSGGVGTAVDVPKRASSRGPRFLYFCDGPVIYRQAVLALSTHGDLVTGCRELLHTGGLIVDRVAAAIAEGVPLDDQGALREFGNRSSTTERYLLPRVLRDRDIYESAWIHVDPHECPACRSDR